MLYRVRRRRLWLNSYRLKSTPVLQEIVITSPQLFLRFWRRI